MSRQDSCFTEHVETPGQYLSWTRRSGKDLGRQATTMIAISALKCR